jgi:hypothetical protein
MRYKATVTVYSEIHTKTHNCNVISMQNFLVLNLVVFKVISFKRLNAYANPGKLILSRDKIGV